HERDKVFKKRKAELTAQFGANSPEVNEYVAQNHPTTGNLVAMKKYNDCRDAIARINKMADDNDISDEEALDLIDLESLLYMRNHSEVHLMCNRKYQDRVSAAILAWVYEPLPYVTQLLRQNAILKLYINNRGIYPGETKLIREILQLCDNLVIIDTACSGSPWNRNENSGHSRDGRDLGYFSPYNTATKRWFVASRLGGDVNRNGVQFVVKEWQGDQGTWNPNLPGTPSVANKPILNMEASQAGVGGVDSLRINSWLVLNNLVPIDFFNLGYHCTFQMGHAGIFGPTRSIVPTPTCKLYMLKERMYRVGHAVSVIQPVMREVPLNLEDSNPSLDVQWLWNLLHSDEHLLTLMERKIYCEVEIKSIA
ncbi:hypothetical protein HK100_012918, partial [Physocladia obscura]